MSFFVNLHTLPTDQHLYTAWVTSDPVGNVQDADEIDFTAHKYTPAATLKWKAIETRDFKVLYGEGYRIVAIADQSTGEKLWAEEGIRTDG